MITERIVYITRGKHFDSKEKAEAHRVDLIGEFISRAPALLGAGDRLALTDYIAKNRAELIDLLNY